MWVACGILCEFCSQSLYLFFIFYLLLAQFYLLFKWTFPLSHKRPFHWISMKSRLKTAARETSKFLKWSQFFNSRRHYMAIILQIRCKRLCNINQSLNGIKIIKVGNSIQINTYLKQCAETCHYFNYLRFHTGI